MSLVFINFNRFVIDFDFNKDNINCNKVSKKNKYSGFLIFSQKKRFSSLSRNFFNTTSDLIVGDDKHSEAGVFDFFDLISKRNLRKFRLKTKARIYFNASSIFSNFCLDRKFKRLNYVYLVNSLKNTSRYFFLRSFKKPRLFSSRYRFKRFLKKKPSLKKIKKKHPFFKLSSIHHKHVKKEEFGKKFRKKFGSKKEILRQRRIKRKKMGFHKIKLNRNLKKKIKKLKIIKRYKVLRRLSIFKSKNRFFRKRTLRFNKRKRLKKNDFISKLKKYNFKRKKNEYKHKRKIKKKIRKTYAFLYLLFKKNSLNYVRHLILSLGKRLQIMPRRDIINFSFYFNKFFFHLPDYYNYIYFYLIAFRKFNLNLSLLSKYFKVVGPKPDKGTNVKNRRRQLFFPKSFAFSINSFSNKNLLNFYLFHSKNLFLMEKYKLHFLLSYFLRKKNKGFLGNLKKHFTSNSNKKNPQKFKKIVNKKQKAFLSFFLSNRKNFKLNAKHLSSGLHFTHVKYISQFKFIKLPLTYHFKRLILNVKCSRFFKKKLLKENIIRYSWYNDLRFRKKISAFIFEKYWKNFLRLRGLFKNLDFFFLISYFLQKLSDYNSVSFIPRLILSMNILFLKFLFILSMSNNFVSNFLQSTFSSSEFFFSYLSEKGLNVKIDEITNHDDIYKQCVGFINFFSYRTQLINDIFIKKNSLKFRYYFLKNIPFERNEVKGVLFFHTFSLHSNVKKKQFSFGGVLKKVRKMFDIFKINFDEKSSKTFKIRNSFYFKKCSSFVARVLSLKLHIKNLGQYNFEGFIIDQQKINHLKEEYIKNININFFKKNSSIIFEKLKLNFALFINQNSFFQVLLNSLSINTEKNSLMLKNQNTNNFSVKKKKKLGKKLKFFRFYRVSKRKKRRFFSKRKIFKFSFKNERRNRIEHDFSSYDNFYKKDEHTIEVEKDPKKGEGLLNIENFIKTPKIIEEEKPLSKKVKNYYGNNIFSFNFLKTMLSAVNIEFYLSNLFRSYLNKKRFFSKRKIRNDRHKEDIFIKKYKEKLLNPHIQSYFLGKENYKKIDYFRNSENYFFTRFNFQEREVSFITQYIYYFLTKSYLKKNSIYKKITYFPRRKLKFYYIDESTYRRVFYFKRDRFRKRKRTKIFIAEKEKIPDFNMRSIFQENLYLKRFRFKKAKLVKRKKSRRKLKLKSRPKVFDVKFKKLSKKKHIFLYLKSNPQNFFATIINRRGKLVGKTSGGLFGNKGPYRSTRHAALGNTKRMLKKFFLYRKRKVKYKRKKKNLKKKRKFIFKLKTLSRKNRWKLLKKNKNKKYDYILYPRYRGNVVIFFRSPVLKRQIKAALLGIMESKFNIIRAYSFLKNPHNGCKRFIPRRL